MVTPLWDLMACVDRDTCGCFAAGRIVEEPEGCDVVEPWVRIIALTDACAAPAVVEARFDAVHLVIAPRPVLACEYAAPHHGIEREIKAVAQAICIDGAERTGLIEVGVVAGDAAVRVEAVYLAVLRAEILGSRGIGAITHAYVEFAVRA